MEDGLNDMAGGVIDQEKNPRYHEEDIEGYNGKWQEVWFLKDGRVKTEAELWDTEAEAKKHINYILGFNCSGPINWVALFDDGEVVPVSDISHAIPMPVKE